MKVFIYQFKKNMFLCLYKQVYNKGGWTILFSFSYFYDTNFFFGLNLVVNVKKIILLHFLFDLKKSCKFFTALIHANDFNWGEINLLF